MGMLAPESVEIRDFLGLMTRLDPYNEPPGGARVQINLTCVTPGDLRLRAGMREVTFEDS